MMVVPRVETRAGGEATIPDSGDQAEPVLDGEGRQTTGPYIDLRGATIFGYEEFARRAAQVQAQNARRAGIWAVA